jgi:glycosyltransferase involved in cell wall biosynthesis
MRVLMVTSSYPKFPGDATAPFIESIALGLARRGHAVDVVLPAHPELRRTDDEPVRFFPYHYAPRESWARWGYAQSLEADVKVRPLVYALAPFAAAALRHTVGRLLLETRYEVAHVHWVIPNAAFIADILGATRIATVVSLHGSDVFMAERNRAVGLLAGKALRGAQSITACSQDLTRRALALGARAARTHTVPYGVDDAFFSLENDRTGWRQRLGLAAGEVLVVAIGRLVEKKGFSYLIDALAGLPRHHLLVVGDGDLRPALAAHARERGVRAFFAGRQGRQGTQDAFAAADIVAIPSIVDSRGNVDGLPNTLLEALASGKAVVASEVAGIPDVVRRGENGLLAPPKDSAALRAALLKLENEDVRRALGRRAADWAAQNLSWQHAAAAFERCYVESKTALDTD